MALEDPIVQTTLRFLHILAGIVWIGHLYFFNLTNLPLLKIQLKQPYAVDMAEKATGNITLKALFWFRWGAMLTLVFGLLLFESLRRARMQSVGDYFLDSGAVGYFILMGVVLGIVMWFNVWFIIWPNQKVILGNNKKIASGVAEDEKKRLQDDNAPRVKNAVMASRINTWLSVPMLFGMVFGAHGGLGIEASTGDPDWESGLPAFLALVLVLLLMVAWSRMKPSK